MPRGRTRCAPPIAEPAVAERRTCAMRGLCGNHGTLTPGTLAYSASRPVAISRRTYATTSTSAPTSRWTTPTASLPAPTSHWRFIRLTSLSKIRKEDIAHWPILAGAVACFPTSGNPFAEWRIGRRTPCQAGEPCFRRSKTCPPAGLAFRLRRTVFAVWRGDAVWCSMAANGSALHYESPRQPVRPAPRRAKKRLPLSF